MPDPYAAIKRRHPDIPQPTLPDSTPEDPGTRPQPRPPADRAIRYAFCPQCHADKPVAVVEGGEIAPEVLRAHNKVLTNGRRIRCSGSGQPAPPAR